MEEVVVILWKQYFPSFGFPEKVATDNAAVFSSRLSYDVLCMGNTAGQDLPRLSTSLSGGII
jgi:hypothetical protein